MGRKLVMVMTLVLIMTVPGSFAPAGAAEKGRMLLVLHLTGKDTGETRPIPPVASSGTREGNCFDLDLIDLLAERATGTATRCFADITSVGNGMAVTDTIVLRLHDGTLTSRSRTTIQPAIDGASPEATHMAVAVPGAETTTLLTEAGSGAFQGMSGRARLAGAMNMSQFRARNEITFNDLVVIELQDRDLRLSEVQKHLQTMGLYEGAIDGVLGPRMREALRQYQAKHGLPTTGELDAATRKALSSQ